MAIDIDFEDKSQQNGLDVTESPLFSLFVIRTFRSPNMVFFNVNKIKSPTSSFKPGSLVSEKITAVSFIFPNGDERPFLIILELANGTKLYYTPKSPIEPNWVEVDEMNRRQKSVQQKLLLQTLKTLFSQFFKTVLIVSESILTTLKYHHLFTKYTILVEKNYCAGYDRYHFKPNTAHSISSITISESSTNFKHDLRFVEKIYFYYVHDDKSMPLLIETFDYKINDEIPLYNYFEATDTHLSSWSFVSCGQNLIEPKCPKDLEILLDCIRARYRKLRLDIDVRKKQHDDRALSTVFFNHVPFKYATHINSYYGYHSLEPRLTKSFMLENLRIGQHVQNIDVLAFEFTIIMVFYKFANPEQPLMICFGLYDSALDKTDRYNWHQIIEPGKTLWLRLAFDAAPDETDKIKEKMSYLFDSRFEASRSSMSFYFKWFFIFCLGGFLGLVLGIRYSRRITFYSNRFFRRLRR